MGKVKTQTKETKKKMRKRKRNQNNPAKTQLIPIPTPISHPSPSPNSALFTPEPVYTGDGDELVEDTEVDCDADVDVEVETGDVQVGGDDDVANVDGDEDGDPGLGRVEFVESSVEDGDCVAVLEVGVVIDGKVAGKVVAVDATNWIAGMLGSARNSASASEVEADGGGGEYVVIIEIGLIVEDADASIEMLNSEV